MLRLTVVLLVAFGILFSDCSCKGGDVPERRGSFETPEDTLWSLENTDPVAQARLAVNSGDKRFLGIDGYAVAVPGIKNEDHDKYVARQKENAVRLLVGTSDVITSQVVRSIMKKSEQYAQKYNAEILRARKAAEATGGAHSSPGVEDQRPAPPSNPALKQP